MSYQRYNPRAVVAVAAGSSGGNIPVDAHGGFCSVTSSSANFVIRAPKDSEAQVGWTTEGWIGATGCEVRLSTSDTAGTINGVDCVSSAFEGPLPATTQFKLQKVATATWLLSALDEGGDDITAPVPN